jgi:tetrapyrrole methylase family protein/MazG family protein
LQNAELYIPAQSRFTPSISPEALTSLAAFLRTPDGCPWDREQSIESLVPSLIEEVIEFEESVQEQDLVHQAEELGDILMNLVMIAQISREDGDYSLEDIVRGVFEKIVRRHPHVFGDEESKNAEDVLAIWQRVKLEEQKLKSV